MRSISLIDATDLESWADRRDAQAKLPQLLRRLVHGTTQGVHRAGFRTGEGVASEGWDGIVVAGEGNAFVPGGISAWEIGVGKDKKGKADDEYKKRTADPKGIVPGQSTFVFVTPRRWSKKDKWAREKQQEGHWREARAYDADDLESWLELAPGVHIWISVLLGKHSQGGIDLENFWVDWSEATNPRISPALVLAGRTEIKERIASWLRDGSALIAVRGESRDEAIATTASVVEDFEPEERSHYLSRILIVRSNAAWHQLASSTESLILIPTFESRDVIARATRAGHRVIVPLGRADSATEATVEIPRLSSEEAAIVLTASGVPEDRSRTLARLARKSLMAFRRKLATSPEVQQPEWARPTNARSLVPILLAGAWNDATERDRQAVSSLANQSYDMVRETLIRWTNEADSPVRRVGDSWFLVSAEDMWALLSPYFIADDLVRLEKVALDVLGEPDPRFELPEEERWMAALKGKVTRHSGLLREGLAGTLALLGSRGEQLNLHGGMSVSDYVEKIVHTLLGRANDDWHIWSSLSGRLRSLAEAAPIAFLSAAEEGLADEAPVLLSLFSDQRSSLFDSSPHTGLLWALETLAWSPDHLGQVSEVLAKLAEIDPGGRLINRPRESLRLIFLPWYPQTSATFDQRLRVIDALRERHPEVAWCLLCQLLPALSQTTHDTPRPHFREWKSERPNVTVAERWKAAHEVFVRMLTTAGNLGTRWKDLINALDDLPQEDCEAALVHLEAMNEENFTTSDRIFFCGELRKFVSHHRSYPQAKWALASKEIDRLAAILDRFEPQDPIAKHGWLFDYNPSLPEGRIDDWKENEEILLAARLEALKIIYSAGGVNGVIKLSKNVKAPYLVGFTLGKCSLLEKEHDSLLQAHLASEDQGLSEFARGIASGLTLSSDQELMARRFDTLGRELSPAQRAVLLVCLPANTTTWDSSAAFGAETEERYWRLVRPHSIREQSSLERELHKFLEYGRPFSAIEALTLSGPTVPAALIADTLERALQTPPRDDPPTSHFSYEVSQLLQVLAESNEIDDSRIAALEWNLLPLLGHQEHVPRRLHKELARNPQFFAEIVSFVYKGEGEETPEPSEEMQARAQRGDELLRSWRTLPGTLPDGKLGAAQLWDWIKHARAATAKSGRAVVGDIMIGEMLSGSPAGTDGAWPHEAVRDVIEREKSPELEDGLATGRFNSRGAVRRCHTEGGAQERELASTYNRFAEAIRDQWPRTAAMLRKMANTYLRMGRRHDEEAELREDLEP